MVAKYMRSDLVQAGESDPKVMSILEEGEVARDPVKVNPNSCCNIFPEKRLFYKYRRLIWVQGT